MVTRATGQVSQKGSEHGSFRVDLDDSDVDESEFVLLEL